MQNEGKPFFSDFRVSFTMKDRKDVHILAVMTCKAGDSVWLTGIRVVEGVHGKFISMPSRKSPNGDFQDIFFPASREVREQFQVLALAAYKREADKLSATGAPV